MRINLPWNSSNTMHITKQQGFRLSSPKFPIDRLFYTVDCLSLCYACHFHCIFFFPFFGSGGSGAFSQTAIHPINSVSAFSRFCLQRFSPITNQQIALYLPCWHDRFHFLYWMNPVIAGANQLAFRYLVLYHTTCPHSMACCMTASSE